MQTGKSWNQFLQDLPLNWLRGPRHLGTCLCGAPRPPAQGSACGTSNRPQLAQPHDKQQAPHLSTRLQMASLLPPPFLYTLEEVEPGGCGAGPQP